MADPVGGTAVADPPVTASPAEETPEKPEPSQQSEPETREPVETPDSVSNEEPETLTKAEHEAALKAEKAKLEESFRRKEENARKEAEDKARSERFTQKQQQAAQARNGLAARSIQSLLNEAYSLGSEGKDFEFQRFAPRLSQVADVLDNMAFQHLHEQYAEFRQALFKEQYPDFAIPQDLAQAQIRATQSYDQKAQVKADHDIFLAAVLADLTPKTRAKVLEELDQEDSETAKERAQRLAEKERTTAQRPTQMQGAPGKARTPRQILDDPNSSVEDRKKALLAETGYQL